MSRKIQITGPNAQKLRDAVKLYENFSGHDAEPIGQVEFPENPQIALAIGDILGVAYETVRDGKVEKYYHAFKKSARPLFVVSHDGKQLFMIGGSYDFTERGIVDQ